MTDTMHGIRINAPGGPEALEWTELDRPEPGAGELLVRVAAAGVNFIDVYHRNGLYPRQFPFTLGVEGSGVVEAVGSDVTDVEPGSKVAWANAAGSYAEFLVIPAEQAVLVPDPIDLEVAAAVMLQGMTAHYLSHDTFPLGEGDTCLIHAGAGGVGHLLVQMAKMRGATVLAVVSTEEKADLARRMGADHVIRSGDGDFGAAVEAVIGPKALDVVFDGVGAATVERGLELLRPRGMMVAFGNASGPVPPIDPLTLMRFGSLFITRPTLFDYIATRGDLERRASDLFRWIADGRLQVNIGLRLPLAAAADAHRALEARATVGKVLLTP